MTTAIFILPYIHSVITEHGVWHSIEKWQDLIGSAIGAILAIGGSVFLYYLQERAKNNHEQADLVEIAKDYAIHAREETRAALQHIQDFTKQLKAFVQQIPNETPYSVKAVRFPAIAPLSLNEDMRNSKIKSQYLRNKIRAANFAIKQINTLLAEEQKDYHVMRRQIEEFTIMEVNNNLARKNLLALHASNETVTKKLLNDQLDMQQSLIESRSSSYRQYSNQISNPKLSQYLEDIIILKMKIKLYCETLQNPERLTFFSTPAISMSFKEFLCADKVLHKDKIAKIDTLLEQDSEIKQTIKDFQEARLKNQQQDWKNSYHFPKYTTKSTIISLNKS